MTILMRDARERTRFLRFAFVGVIGAFVDFGVMNLLVTLFDSSLVLAGTISFIAAIISNFTWNRFWTYPDSRSKALVKQLMMFAIVSIVGLIIRVSILALIEPIVMRALEITIPQLNQRTLDLLDNNITLAVAVLIVMFWNFFVNRYWTYSDVE